MPYVYKENYSDPLVLSCLNIARELIQCHLIDFSGLIATEEANISYSNSQSRNDLDELRIILKHCNSLW